MIYLLYVDEEMDGKAIQQTYATRSGPDCLRDVIPKYGQRVKVYNFIKQAIDSAYQSLNESTETPSLPPSQTSTPIHNKSIVQVCMSAYTNWPALKPALNWLIVSTTNGQDPSSFEVFSCMCVCVFVLSLRSRITLILRVKDQHHPVPVQKQWKVCSVHQV